MTLNNTSFSNCDPSFEEISPNLRWLLLVLQVFVFLPLSISLPVWLVGVCVFAMLWRASLNYRRRSVPAKVLLWFLLFVLALGLGMEFLAHQFSLNVNIALLTSLFIFKSLELKQHRDVVWLLYLSFIVIACVLLQQQSLLISVYLLLLLSALLGLLIASYATHFVRYRDFKTGFKKSLWIGFQALPICFFLIVFMPRIAPLWQVPLNTSQAKTGMSDSMQPGSIANLLRSSELVFRVKFNKAIPEPSNLYWRALVLSDFDGVSWLQHKAAVNINYEAITDTQDIAALMSSQQNKQLFDYEVMLEPSQQKWLYSLAIVDPSSVLLLSDKKTRDKLKLTISQASTLFSHMPITQRIRYKLASNIRQSIHTDLSASEYRRQISIPPHSNPLAQAFAKKIFSQVGSNPERMVSALLDWFTQKNFYYTLEPPLLDQSKHIDEFLFQSRRGFCEHYAGAVAFLLRAVGIPARVVVGYQGGKRLMDQKRVIVREFDAHAWVEWWSVSRGWLRVDPTAAVAPQRVEIGAEQALSGQSGFLADELGVFGDNNVAWISQLRWKWERINYNWNRWVLGFNEAQRQGFLERLLGGVDSVHIIKGFVYGMLCCVALVLLMIYLPQLVSSRPNNVWVTYYKRLLWLSAVNENSMYLPPTQWARALKKEFPTLSDDIDQYIEGFNQLQYQPPSCPGVQSPSISEQIQTIKEHKRKARVLIYKLLLAKVKK